jgi:hypothetical protein
VHATGAVLDHHKEVEAAEEDGVDVGEVDREDRVSLCGEELSPGRSGAQGSGVDAGVPQIFQTVEAAMWWLSPTSSPWMRR